MDAPDLLSRAAGPAVPASDAPWPTVVAIVGPTASGKTDLALALARTLGGEIVNADAFQVYRGMDIGTAKPTHRQRQLVRHHLIDVLDVTEDLSVAHYQRMGRQVLAGLARDGVPAVVVGGSGLYVRALLDDLRLPGHDPSIRARWEHDLAERGPGELHRELAARDPQAASRILPTNGRRIVRALEVLDLTGEPFHAELDPSGPPLVPHLSVGLHIERPLLDERIAQRVRRMLDEGLEQEVRGLLGRGLREGRTASRALGYPQVIALLDGALTREQACDAIVTATRRYARRQQRWFRRDARTAWVDAGSEPSSTASAIAARVAAATRTLGS
jgi:tRNA dimethylallyltransferase